MRGLGRDGIGHDRDLIGGCGRTDFHDPRLVVPARGNPRCDRTERDHHRHMRRPKPRAIAQNGHGRHTGIIGKS